MFISLEISPRGFFLEMEIVLDLDINYYKNY